MLGEARRGACVNPQNNAWPNGLCACFSGKPNDLLFKKNVICLGVGQASQMVRPWGFSSYFFFFTVILSDLLLILGIRHIQDTNILAKRRRKQEETSLSSQHLAGNVTLFKHNQC